MTQFKYTCHTFEKFVGGDVYSNDLDTIKNYCKESAEDHGYSYVRDNVTNEIVYNHGNVWNVVS